MAGARMKRPDAGYTPDFVSSVMGPLVCDIAEKAIKVISNAGGINPLARRDALKRVMEEAAVDLRIAVVLGDDLMPKKSDLYGRGVREMFAGALLPPGLVTLNAYLGAKPIADALSQGAHIVLTSRIVDSALSLGPLIHEFGWALDNYDTLAQDGGPPFMYLLWSHIP